jgi:DNA (cytosine-5)-methyltransferase 1
MSQQKHPYRSGFCGTSRHSRCAGVYAGTACTCGCHDQAVSLNVLSLFSGIDGLGVGLERAGMRVVGQVELDEFCRSQLAVHWPDVPRHDDARTAAEWWLSQERPAVDVIAGGPPCQPFSTAGSRLRWEDERNGWPWFLDTVRAIRPRWVIAENVPEVLGNAEVFSRILGSLSDLGFAVEWDVVSACSLGAPHRRTRLLTVAYPDTFNGQARLGPWQDQRLPGLSGWTAAGGYGSAGARAWSDLVDRSVEAAGRDGRNADGSAGRMVAAAGNAVVPQVAEYIGRMIVAADSRVAA